VAMCASGAPHSASVCTWTRCSVVGSNVGRAIFLITVKNPSR
jgi:hypothetical protein